MKVTTKKTALNCAALPESLPDITFTILPCRRGC